MVSLGLGVQGALCRRDPSPQEGAWEGTGDGRGADLGRGSFDELLQEGRLVRGGRLVVCGAGTARAVRSTRLAAEVKDIAAAAAGEGSEWE